jgi:hypothetical protein
MKVVQRLTGKIIALNMFISYLEVRCLPFFKTLKNISNFKWTLEYQQALKDLKLYMSC